MIKIRTIAQVLFQVVIGFIFLASFRVEAANNNLKSDDIFIESKLSSISENFSTFEKDVITLKSDLILNSEELNYVKISLYKKALDQKKDNDFMVEINSDFKTLLDDGTFAYGKFLNFNKKEAISFGRKVQVFLQSDSGSLFGDLIIKTPNGYIVENCFFSSCTLSEDKLEEQRIEMLKHGFYNIREVAEPKQKIITRYSEDEVKDQYSFKPWLLRAKKMYIDKIENRVYMEHAWVRFFGVPVMYSPYFSYPLGKEGQSGLLLPKFILLGGLSAYSQAGVEIPFYFRLANNIDFIISRSEYFSVMGTSYQSQNPNSSTDFGNNRISTTNFQLRHLLSTKHRFMSYYKAEGILTDRAILINQYGGTNVDNSGNAIYGLRGFFSLKGEVALSKNLFTRIDYLWTSDINFLYMYRMTYLSYKKNFFEFRYTDEHQNHSVELVNYTTPSLYLPSSFISYMPVIRSHINFDKDKFGGNFYYDFYSNFINKAEVLRNFNARFKAGYHLSRHLSTGSRIIVDAENYLQYNNIDISYNNYNSSVISAPGTISNQTGLQNLNYILGNYQYLLNSQIFGNLANSNSFLSGINSRIQLEHPFVFHQGNNTFKFKPILSLRYSQPFTLSGITNLANITGMSTMMDAYSVSNFNRIQAFSIFEYGASTQMGLNTYFSTKYITGDFTAAFEKRFFNGFMPNYNMLNFVGLGNSSNIFLALTMNFFGFFYTANTRVSSITGKLLQLDQSFGRMLLANKLMLVIGHLYLTPDASFIGRSMNMLNFSINFRLIGDLFISGSISWDFANNPTYYFQQGLTSSMLSYSVGFLYQRDCYNAGIFVSQSYITPVGVPSVPVPTFRFDLKPKFEAGVSPGGRQLPTKELDLNDL